MRANPSEAEPEVEEEVEEEEEEEEVQDARQDRPCMREQSSRGCSSGTERAILVP